MSKRKTPKISKKFGELLGEFEEKGKITRVYKDGNQIYFVKSGKIQPDMTMHIDDIDELLTMLNTIITMKENQENAES